MAVSVILLGGAAISQADTIVRAGFNMPPETAREVYLPGGTWDVLEGVSYFQRSWDPVGPTGGWLANQFRAPNIVIPPTDGLEWGVGNALEGNSNSAPGTRQGYWIALQTPITGSFTAEAVFLLRTYTPTFAEYKMQNIISTFWMSDGKAFELRTLGDFGNRVIQCMTNDGSSEHNITSAENTIQDNTWYHGAVVYDASASQVELFLDGSSLGPADPLWGTFSMQWLCIAAWPNPAGVCRDIDGYMDGFALSDAVLGPGEFVLLSEPPPTPTIATGVGVPGWEPYR